MIVNALWVLTVDVCARNFVTLGMGKSAFRIFAGFSHIAWSLALGIELPVVWVVISAL